MRGRPLYVALSYDWLNNEVGTLEELLNSPEPFGAELVGWVRRFSAQEKLAILYLALAWRRMEIPLLAHLLKIDEQHAEQLAKGLSEFSFVKYRPAGAYTTVHLHDEMRELVRQYVWPKEEVGDTISSDILSQTTQWYESTIGDPEVLSGKRPSSDERQRTLLAERLFYRSQIDLDEAMCDHEALFRTAVHHLDLTFCDLLNQEVGRSMHKMSSQQRDDLRFRQALTDFRREKYLSANETWSSLLNNKNLLPTLRATILMLQVELGSYTGKPDEAIEHAREAERLYQELLTIESNPGKKERLTIELGQLYNNWGYTCRVKGNFDQALESYKKALKATSPKEQPGKHRARVLNNMGYVYFRQGDVVRARSYVGRGLSIREQLGIPYELGLGYNTMGMIMEDLAWIQDAVDLYHKAYLAFEQAGSRRGKALASLNLGRIKRIVNDYDSAIRELENTRAVFKRLEDRDQLIAALNELGCTYRGRKEPGDLEKALELLNSSLELSREMGKFFEIADNLEDISITYYKLALEAGSDTTVHKEYIEQARKYARAVIDMVNQREKAFLATYLKGKASRTLGDLAFMEEKYDLAFDQYFESCLLMARAWNEGKRASVFLQRQYDDSLDRMQEQLHSLDTKQALMYAKKLAGRLQQLPKPEQMMMAKMKAYLHATRETARLVG